MLKIGKRYNEYTYKKKGDLSMKNKNSLAVKFCEVAADLALKVTETNVNTACMLIAHQPKLPKGAEKLRKF